MTESADTPAGYIDNGTLDPLPGHELPSITLDELRRGSVSVPEPPTMGEPTLAHDLAVQAALYSRAVGYTRTKQVLDRAGNPVDITEDMPPDPTSAVKWLQARRPAQWREPDPSQGKPQSISITVTVHGEPRVTIGQVYEHEPPPPGLIGRAGG